MRRKEWQHHLHRMKPKSVHSALNCAKKLVLLEKKAGDDLIAGAALSKMRRDIAFFEGRHVTLARMEKLNAAGLKFTSNSDIVADSSLSSGERHAFDRGVGLETALSDIYRPSGR